MTRHIEMLAENSLHRNKQNLCYQQTAAEWKLCVERHMTSSLNKVRATTRAASVTVGHPPQVHRQISSNPIIIFTVKVFSTNTKANDELF